MAATARTEQGRTEQARTEQREPAPKAEGRIGRGARRRSRRGPAPATPYLMATPALLVIGALLMWPIAQIVWMSFHKVGPQQVRAVDPAPPQWVGGDNYHAILGDGFFWQTLRNTVLFAVVAVVLTMLVGTLVGLMLDRIGRVLSAIVATGALLAWATPAISAAIVFRWLFEATGGLANWVLLRLPDPLVGGGWEDYSWFSTPLPTYTVLVLCVVWQSYPFVAISVLAGLKSVPGEMYEAARIDGAGGWRLFWSITYPMLRPVFSILLVLSVIWDFKVFTQLFVLAGGTANRDAFNLSLYSYSTAFGGGAPKYGLGSAIAVVLTVLLLVVTGLYVRQMVRKGEVA